ECLVAGVSRCADDGPDRRRSSGMVVWSGKRTDKLLNLRAGQVVWCELPNLIPMLEQTYEPAEGCRRRDYIAWHRKIDFVCQSETGPARHGQHQDGRIEVNVRIEIDVVKEIPFAVPHHDEVAEGIESAFVVRFAGSPQRHRACTGEALG